MRNLKPLMVLAALFVPLFWTGALRAAEEPTQTIDLATNPGDPGPGGGIAPESETTMTTEGAVVTGTVVGTNCWLARGLEGDKYRDSAVACARYGTPLSILTDAGELIYPIALGNAGNYQPDMQTVMKFAEQRVKVTGKLMRRGGERAIVIDSIESAPEPRKERTFAVKETPGAKVTGRVVDLDCWIAKGNKAATDAKCIGDCAIAGDPLVLVTRGGRVYYPVSLTMPASPVGAARLSKYCGQQVDVSGTVVDRGSARGIMISEVTPIPVK